MYMYMFCSLFFNAFSCIVRVSLTLIRDPHGANGDRSNMLNFPSILISESSIPTAAVEAAIALKLWHYYSYQPFVGPS